MIFNTHFSTENRHAFLGASKYHWINYDLKKMKVVWENHFNAQIGDRKHAFAAEAIRLKHKMAKNNLTLNAYVNDAIGFRMSPEVPLVYSDNCFGTPDAIGFEKQILRIHDLKTGTHPGSEHQLEVYCALFCLEYKYNPYDIEMLTRIYQSDQIFKFEPDPTWIRKIMDKIVEFDQEIERMKAVMA